MGSTFYIPAQNLMGSGAVAEAINTMRAYGFKRVLIVTDAYMSRARSRTFFEQQNRN